MPSSAGLSTRSRKAGRLLAGLLLTLLAVGLAEAAGARVPAPGVFLVASRDATSLYFRHSVVFLIRHDPQGSLGVIVNRPTRFHLNELLPEFDVDRARKHVIYLGGPVASNTIVMLMRQVPPSTGIRPVIPGVQFSAELPVLETLIRQDQPASRLRCYAGHAAWAPRQLDRELAAGAWHLVAADVDAVFSESSEDLWERLINRADPPGIRVQGPSSPGGAGRWIRPGPTPAVNPGRTLALWYSPI